VFALHNNHAKLEVGWSKNLSLNIKKATKGIEKGGFQLVNFNVFRFLIKLQNSFLFTSLNLSTILKTVAM
jgi:hypothetical protein